MKKVEKPFNFARMKTLEDFLEQMKNANIDLPSQADLYVLKEPVKISNKTAPNRLCIHPLEGFDGTEAGDPSELTFRRYKRYSQGGAGMIWYESFTISDDGRCNPLQVIIKDSTLPEIKRLVAESVAAAQEVFGKDYRPYNILQLTHSGRRSVNEKWESTPLATVENPYLDSHNSIDGSTGEIVIATDEKIEEIIADFIQGAVLAKEAGFDSVDIKVCHEYILRELLASFTRPGKYGGSFENRSRALFDIIDGIREKLGDSLDICVRLNAYDCIPYPYGWGMVKKEGVMEPDLTEPIKLCKMLVERNVRLINLSTMMPRYQPYGRGVMAEHEEGEEAAIKPYESTAYLLKATRDIKAAVPGGLFVCTGITWFEQFGANVAAACIEDEWFDFAGFGRQGFAYPDFANDILQKNQLERKKCCITCDKCYDLIQKGHTVTGCVIRDKVYQDIYKQRVLGRK